MLANISEKDKYHDLLIWMIRAGKGREGELSKLLTTMTKYCDAFRTTAKQHKWTHLARFYSESLADRVAIDYQRAHQHPIK